MDEDLIIVEDITYAYSSGFKLSPPTPIINHISFKLKRGEILAFLGPNGAGKSTTMRLLSGNLPSHSGKIKISGFDLIKQNIQAKSCIGYLADTPPLYLDQKVDEYLIYCAKLHGLTRQQITKALEDVKQRCGLKSVGHQLIAQLSKGMQQRIGIAQAIIHQPDIIILDEPSNGLDPVQRHEILGLIKQLGKLHSVILSTHSWSDVIQAGCNKVQIINQGSLVYQDSIENLSKQMHSNCLLIRCSHTIEIEKIQNIKGIVDCIVDKANSCVKVICDTSLNQAEIEKISSNIVNLSYQQNWQLYEIKSEKKSFDEVFLSLATKRSID